MKGGTKMTKLLSKLSKYKKFIAVSAIMAIMSVFSSISCFAADESASAKTAFSTALSTIQSDIMGYIILVIPVGLAIFGAIIAIKKGISFVRTLIGR